MSFYRNILVKKKLIIFLTFFIFCTVPMTAQISQEEANEIVQAHLLNEQLDFKFYFNTNSPNDKALEIKTTQQESVKIKYACFAYFLKETDDASEPAQCRYLFVKTDSGNLLEIITTNDLGPEDITHWVTLGLDNGWVRTFLPYPNPVDEWLNVPTKGVRTTIQVFDLNGSLILSETVSEKEVHQLNVSSLNAGIYILRINNETEKFNYKFIKN